MERTGYLVRRLKEYSIQNHLTKSRIRNNNEEEKLIASELLRSMTQ